MTDSLGWRMKFGVIAPSTNTSVQPEFEGMRPRGVTNHFSRVVIPDTPVNDDAQFMEMMENIRGATEDAIDSVMTCSPGHIIMGMSAETFWEGTMGAEQLKQKLEQRAGLGITLGSHACRAAISKYGNIKRIAVITPYMPIGDDNVRRFFTESGYEVVALEGLKCKSPMLIAHESPRALIDAIKRVDDPSVELVIQVGTNLAFAHVAQVAELWLDKPVLAINTCTYWHALRTNGFDDKIDGYGSLLLDH